MKTILGLMLTACGLMAIGCTTTPKSPADKWTADRPPPLVKNADPGATEVPAVKLSNAKKRLTENDIDESNAEDSVRLLGDEMLTEKRAMTKAGR